MNPLSVDAGEASGEFRETADVVAEVEKIGLDVCWVAEARDSDGPSGLGYHATRVLNSRPPEQSTQVCENWATPLCQSIEAVVATASPRVSERGCPRRRLRILPCPVSLLEVLPRSGEASPERVREDRKPLPYLYADLARTGPSGGAGDPGA
ncbi:hypothetical protein CU254_17270 [Amycolatopsis sp. AA4]|nr:hypothetical protein CU254_17270 [Amycolatopsis sp. AA4]EFL07721.1 predicted protein [Streptomyces sp. AA4]